MVERQLSELNGNAARKLLLRHRRATDKSGVHMAWKRNMTRKARGSDSVQLIRANLADDRKETGKSDLNKK